MMIDIVLSLVYAAPLLIIMAFPAMKITEFIEKRTHVSENIYNKLTVIITIVLSLIGGIVLHMT